MPNPISKTRGLKLVFITIYPVLSFGLREGLRILRIAKRFKNRNLVKTHEKINPRKLIEIVLLRCLQIVTIKS